MSGQLVLSVRGVDAAARVLRFAAGEVELGRDPGADVLLADPGVSGIHARISRRGAGYEVVDPGSAHGTWLGESRLVTGVPVPLASGDALRIGPYTIEVYLDAGGGFTSDTRDSAHIARVWAADRARTQAGGYMLAVLTGPQAGALIPLDRHPPRWFGEARQVGVAIDRDGQVVATPHAAGARVRGRALVRPVVLTVGDRLQLGEILVELRGPAPESRAPRWTTGEVLGALVALAALAAGVALLIR